MFRAILVTLYMMGKQVLGPVPPSVFEAPSASQPQAVAFQALAVDLQHQAVTFLIYSPLFITLKTGKPLIYRLKWLLYSPPKTNPKATLFFARVGFGASCVIAGASAVVWAKEAGVLMLGKPLLALGAYGAGKLTGYGLEKAGVEKEGAEFWGDILGGLGFGVTAGRASFLQSSPSWARAAGTWLEGNFSGVMGKEVGSLGLMEKPIGQLFAKDAAPAVGNQFANLTDEQISAAIQEKASVRSAAVAGKVIRAENTGTRSARVEMATEFVRDVLLENNPMRNQIVAATQDDVQRHVSDLTPPMSGTLKRVTAWTVDFITLPFKPARLLYGW